MDPSNKHSRLHDALLPWIFQTRDMGMNVRKMTNHSVSVGQQKVSKGRAVKFFNFDIEIFNTLQGIFINRHLPLVENISWKWGSLLDNKTPHKSRGNLFRRSQNWCQNWGTLKASMEWGQYNDNQWVWYRAAHQWLWQCYAPLKFKQNWNDCKFSSFRQVYICVEDRTDFKFRGIGQLYIFSIFCLCVKEDLKK